MARPARKKVLQSTSIRNITFDDLRIRVIEPATGEAKIIPFVPNAVQEQYLDLLAEKYPPFDWRKRIYTLHGVREDVCKARQQGQSTLWLALYFLDTYNHPSVESHTYAHDGATTRKLFWIVHRFYKHLPELVKRPLRRSNQYELVFDDTDSGFFVGMVGGGSLGRGGTVSNIHISERAWNDNYPELELGLFPSVPERGNITRETTANGLNEYYQERQRVNAGLTRFTPRFFGWHLTPHYRMTPPVDFQATDTEIDLARTYNLDREQLAWRREQMKTYKERLPQEFPICLAPDTFLSTKRGIISIMEIVPGDVTESGEVTRFFANPPRPVFKLTTRCGRILRGTAEHPIATTEGFIALSALQPGQTVILRGPRFAEHDAVITWCDPPMVTHIVTVTDELARFLGYFAGDGSWHAGNLSIANDAKDQDVVADTVCLVSYLFGVEPRMRTISRVQGRAGCVELRAGLTSAIPLMDRLGVLKRTKRGPHENEETATGFYVRKVCVPECIKRSTESVVRQFLRGLFEADGSVTIEGVVRLGLRQVEVLRDVQLLLLGFGINSRITGNPRKAGSGHVYEEHMLILNTAASRVFVDKIGFIGARKNGRLQTAAHEVRKPTKISVNLMEDEVCSVEPDGEDCTYNVTIG